MFCQAYQNLGYKRWLRSSYRVGEEIGRGGKGIVRIVTDPRDFKYACKTIQKDGTAIEKEVHVLQTLSGCDLIADLIDVYEDDSHLHIITELCRGGTLDGGVCDEQETKVLMRQVLRVIEACHGHDIVHRDIKPGNFVRVADPTDVRIKGIDFGLSDVVPFDEPEMKGTLWYMAPEMFASRVGREVDIWAAGVMTAELLTGKMPFDDKRNRRCPEMHAVIRSVLSDQYDHEGSEGSRDFIAALLTRDPKKRPTVTEMLQHPWLQ